MCVLYEPTFTQVAENVITYSVHVRITAYKLLQRVQKEIERKRVKVQLVQGIINLWSFEKVL
jgi:hypothetical protein